jgi:hypothetical protein
MPLGFDPMNNFVVGDFVPGALTICAFVMMWLGLSPEWMEAALSFALIDFPRSIVRFTLTRVAGMLRA